MTGNPRWQHHRRDFTPQDVTTTAHLSDQLVPINVPITRPHTLSFNRTHHKPLTMHARKNTNKTSSNVPCTSAQTAPAQPDSVRPPQGLADRTETSRSAPHRTGGSYANPSAARVAAAGTASIPPFGVCFFLRSAVPPSARRSSPSNPSRRCRHRCYRFRYLRCDVSRLAPRVWGRRRPGAPAAREGLDMHVRASSGPRVGWLASLAFPALLRSRTFCV